MRNRMNLIDMSGVIVIGEGEMDEAPRLYIDEKLGTDNGPHVDIAVDPVEGTTLMAKGKGRSLTVIAVPAKEACYMHQICIWKKLPLVQRQKAALISNYHFLKI